MEWWLVLLIIFGGVIAVMATGIPVAFAFAICNIVALSILMDGGVGLSLLPGSIYASVTEFHLIALPMFFFLGSVLYHAGVFGMVMDVTDKWIGRIRARLLFVSLGAGTVMASLSGAGAADTALLGSTLYPEMEKRGYDKKLSLGVIASSGLLAVLIPPSGLAVLLGSLANVSIAKLLIGGIVPALMMVVIYSLYVIGRVKLDPSLAPTYPSAGVPLREKLIDTAKLVPLGIIIFCVIGFILFGITTPSEAAATGAISAIVVTAIYGRLNWNVLTKATLEVVKITGMIFLIITGATAFGQVVALSGAAREFVAVLTDLPLSSFMILLLIQFALFVLGCFVDPVSIMMIAIPILGPVIPAFGWDPVWFYVLFLMNITMGNMTPPFGIALFVLKGVVPNVSLGTIYRAQLPFVAMDMLAIVLVAAFPQIALWLPNIS